MFPKDGTLSQRFFSALQFFWVLPRLEGYLNAHVTPVFMYLVLSLEGLRLQGGRQC